MMRKTFALALLSATLCLVGITRDAGATVTIELEWGECGGGTGGCTATGSNTIAVNPGGGQTLRLDIFLSHDLTQGMIGHMFSLNFDTDLGNELNLGPMAAVEYGTIVYPGPAVTYVYGPFTAGLGGTVESTGAVAGRVNSFESATIFTPLPRNGATYSVGTFTGTAPARYLVGQAFFTTNGAVTDGADVFSGQFNALFDHFQDGNDVPIPQGTVAYGNASLNLVPEPGTLSLLGLGLVGLILGARRSRA